MNLEKSLNRYIDHTLLKPEARQEDFEKLVEESIDYQFETLCVSPYMAVPIKNILNATGYSYMRVGTVIDFPLGNSPLALKLNECAYFIEKGIDELDFVLNYGELKNNNFKAVVGELQNISNLCKQGGVVSKCIVETANLTTEEKTTIFHYIKDYAPNLDYIKTSTGFASKGAQIEDIILWNSLRGNNPRPLIKASGGIKTLDQCLALIEAGADRLGMSAGVGAMEEFIARKKDSNSGRKEEA